MLLKFARRALVFATNLYLIGLGVYLLLRLTTADQWWWLALLNNFLPFYFLPLLVLLPLALILRAKRILAMTVIFAAIGAVWFAPRFIPRARAAVAGSTLTIATFNVWHLNHHLDEIEAWIRSTDADVVFLQEITQEHVDDLLPRLRDVYPYQLTQNRTTLSRYPLSITEQTGQEPPAVQRYTLDWNDTAVALYNAHMMLPVRDSFRLTPPIDNPFVRMAYAYDDQGRNNQINDLLAQIDSEPYPFIVAGDFNMSDYTHIYGDLAARMGDSFHEVGCGLGTSWPISAYEEIPAFIPPLFRIDYIWHSHHFQAIHAEQGPRLGSDHLPLVADVVLNN